MPKHVLFKAITAVILIAAVSGISSADTELSLYTGETSFSDTDFDVYYFASGSVRRKEHFDASSLKGLRLARWSDDWRWFGGALDLSSVTGRSVDMDLHVMPLSALLLFRLSFLESEAFPRGTLHPYLGIGPSFVYYRYSLDYRPAISEVLNVTSFDIGTVAVGGLTWQFSRHVGLFAEYRYMKFSIDDEKESMDWLLGFPSVITERIRADMETRQYVGGVTFFF